MLVLQILLSSKQGWNDPIKGVLMKNKKKKEMISQLPRLDVAILVSDSKLHIDLNLWDILFS